MTLEESARLLLHGIPPKKTVTLYVRKGDTAKERIISINPIPAGDPINLLNAGFAIDGNSATLSVDPQTYVVHHHGEDAHDKSGLRYHDDQRLYAAMIEGREALHPTRIVSAEVEVPLVSQTDRRAAEPHVVAFHRWTPGGTLPGEWAGTWTLTKAINAVETALVDWLQALGYEVKFG